MNLEDIKKKKLQELQQQLESQQNQYVEEQAQIQQQIAQLESVLKNYLSNDAWLRYSNIKVAHPENSVRILAMMAQLIQNGQFTGRIDDNQFKSILKQIQGPKKEFRVVRK